MLKRSRLPAITLALLFSLPLAVGCPQPLQAKAVAPAPDAVLKDLQNLEELRARFNQDKGVPRLILLLSPT
jgi:hypothetical protein